VESKEESAAERQAPEWTGEQEDNCGGDDVAICRGPVALVALDEGKSACLAKARPEIQPDEVIDFELTLEPGCGVLGGDPLKGSPRPDIDAEKRTPQTSESLHPRKQALETQCTPRAADETPRTSVDESTVEYKGGVGQQHIAEALSCHGVGELMQDEDVIGVGPRLPDALRKRLEQRSMQRPAGQTAGDRGAQEPRAKSVHVDAQQSRTPWARPRTMKSEQLHLSTSAERDATPRKQAPQPRKSAKAANIGGAPPEEGNRQMFDKNTLRSMHRDLFAAAIQRHRQQWRPLDFGGGDGGATEVAEPDLAECTLKLSPNAVCVYARKRPISAEEAARGEYDVVSVPPGQPLPTDTVVHNCLFQADLKTPVLHHLRFEFDHVFRENAQDHEVYRVAAADMVARSRDGGVATILMFGATGSGKTHTMTAIECMAAHALFENSAPEAGPCRLAMQFVELRGNRCFDLLASGSRDVRPELRLREQPDGSYAVEAASQLQPKTPEELCNAMRAAHARRATSATGANAVSSRSHAVCTLYMFGSNGQLTLADCAGTERRKDSAGHSKEQQHECAEINTSLHALKECIRYASEKQHVPSHAYRASALTKLMAGAFTRAHESRLAVICTASPCASDTEHTVSTLRMGAMLAGRGTEQEEHETLVPMQRPREAHPKQWSPEQVCVWLSELHGGRFSDVQKTLPSNFTGQMLVRLTEIRCTQLCGGERTRGRMMFDALHQEMRRAEQARNASSCPAKARGHRHG